MGTRFELVLCRGDRAESALRSAGEEALREIVELDAKLSRFRRDSVVSFLQREAVHRAVPLEPDLFELFAECEAIRVASGGLFDIAVGASMERWGFHDDVSEEEGPVWIDEADVQESRGSHEMIARRAWPHGTVPYRLDHEARSIHLRPGTRLDLGGVAKGFALDRSALILRDLGIDRALLHGGTSAIVAIGAPPDRAGWSIQLAGPGVGPDRHTDSDAEREPDSASPTLDLRDEALAVSTPFGRVVDDRQVDAAEDRVDRGVESGAEDRARTRGHIIDPRRSEPAPAASLPALVAIRGPSCLVCDAWTKPALLGGTRPLGLDLSYQCIIHR